MCRVFILRTPGSSHGHGFFLKGSLQSTREDKLFTRYKSCDFYTWELSNLLIARKGSLYNGKEGETHAEAADLRRAALHLLPLCCGGNCIRGPNNTTLSRMALAYFRTLEALARTLSISLCRLHTDK